MAQGGARGGRTFRGMIRVGAMAAVAALGLVGGGCAGQDTVDGMQETNRSLANQLAQVRAGLDEGRAGAVSEPPGVVPTLTR